MPSPMNAKPPNCDTRLIVSCAKHWRTRAGYVDELTKSTQCRLIGEPSSLSARHSLATWAFNDAQYRKQAWAAEYTLHR
jgi:hypothetical protein